VEQGPSAINAPAPSSNPTCKASTGFGSTAAAAIAVSAGAAVLLLRARAHSGGADGGGWPAGPIATMGSAAATWLSPHLEAAKELQGVLQAQTGGLTLGRLQEQTLIGLAAASSSQVSLRRCPTHVCVQYWST